MSIDNQVFLNNNILLKKFLHENPKYYKYLNRDNKYIYELNNIMKDKYKLTLSDRINNLKNKIDMVNTFIDIFN